LEVDGTHAPVDRPKFVQIRGRTLHGDVFEVTADETVARVCQHEIDHLDGIEYVQRLTGEAHDRVYEVMEADGIDVGVLPDAPY
jgi:peptide deformylase